MPSSSLSVRIMMEVRMAASIQANSTSRPEAIEIKLWVAIELASHSVTAKMMTAASIWYSVL